MVRIVRRGFVLGVATVAAQAAYARFRGVPSFDGLDPSGVFGEQEMPTLRIVILGDSTVTAPGLDDPDDSWARISARHFEGRYRVELTCLAVGGARSRDVLEDQLPAALASEWDIAVVSVGSNDVLNLVPIWLFERRLDEIVARLNVVARAVVLFGVGDLGSIPRVPFPLDRFAWWSGHIADWVHRRVAARYGVAKVDQWNQTTEPFNSGIHMFAPDLFHPSPAGHRAWAGALTPTLETVVGELD